MSGMKQDAGKPPVARGFMSYFPRAVIAVANISAYGFAKYKSWGGWVTVEDGQVRYEEACQRHTVAPYIDGPYDPESKLLHLAHRAWDAMAALELALRGGSSEVNPEPVKIIPHEFTNLVGGGNTCDVCFGPKEDHAEHLTNMLTKDTPDDTRGQGQAKSKRRPSRARR